MAPSLCLFYHHLKIRLDFSIFDCILGLTILSVSLSVCLSVHLKLLSYAASETNLCPATCVYKPTIRTNLTHPKLTL